MKQIKSIKWHFKRLKAKLVENLSVYTDLRGELIRKDSYHSMISDNCGFIGNYSSLNEERSDFESVNQLTFD